MLKISTYSSPQGLAYLALGLPSTSTRDEAYDAIQAHYEALYGPHVVITVQHLSSTPEDREEGTVRHSAAVVAKCDHGLTERIATVNVVTQEGRT